jgi:ubiquinone/menaquinone biosynthesis C-methylase UbiE
MSYHECQRIDYDRIATRYDADRHRAKSVDLDLVAYLNGRAGPSAENIAVLDVGCGTGNQLVADRDCFPGVRLVGLDLFHGMLREAAGKTDCIGWVQGDGAQLPFASRSFDYVSSQFSFHHVRDKTSMLREVFRVLRPDGRFVMVNVDPWGMPGWAVYRYFPTAWDQDQVDFCPVREIERLLRRSGFERIETTVDHSEREQDPVEFARDMRRRVVSQVALLSETDYAAGLRRVEDELLRDARRELPVPSELCIVKITADKEYT